MSTSFYKNLYTYARAYAIVFINISGHSGQIKVISYLEPSKLVVGKWSGSGQVVRKKQINMYTLLCALI